MQVENHAFIRHAVKNFPFDRCPRRIEFALECQSAINKVNIPSRFGLRYVGVMDALTERTQGTERATLGKKSIEDTLHEEHYILPHLSYILKFIA